MQNQLELEDPKVLKGMPFDEAMAKLRSVFEEEHGSAVFDDIPKLLGDIIGNYEYDEETFPALRSVYRHWLMGEALTGGKKQTTYELTFSGSGDSGSYYNDSGDPLMDVFLTNIAEAHVHWDWYNNDGGGGTVTWDLVPDTIHVVGYTNILETVSEDGVEI